MLIRENVRYDKALKNRIDSNTLRLSDYVLLTLANSTAECLPNGKVYIVGKQQGVIPPAAFVSLYSLENNRKLKGTSEYSFGFELSYVPEDWISTAELTGFAFDVEQLLSDDLESEIGKFSVYETDYGITDQIAHVTGTIRALEITVPDGEIINTATKGLITD